ncbi:MAG: cytochrome-c peroxidase [Holophagaceae bacterium]|uniref:Cytochrome-c peroxidase n=1 Tax=Candidatus Geothrix odensensis TaxID=2954440 RepID=A0A936F5Z8_9BACT|nr:cytochrome-c peroxidase [Candidatus Geothrix odensensis]
MSGGIQAFLRAWHCHQELSLRGVAAGMMGHWRFGAPVLLPRSLDPARDETLAPGPGSRVVARGGGLARGNWPTRVRCPARGPAGPPTRAPDPTGGTAFFDPRLSLDGTRSCASCHDPAKARANHDRTDTGVLGRVGGRNSGTVLDAARMEHQFWDGRAASSRTRGLGPHFESTGNGETAPGVLAKLEAIPSSVTQFRSCVPGRCHAGPRGQGPGQPSSARWCRALALRPFPAGRVGPRPEAARRGLELLRKGALLPVPQRDLELSNQGFGLTRGGA